jgi:CPA2 family monovalent cation:H+ antiporter-2
LGYYPGANLVVKVNTLEEKSALADIKINSFVHAQQETAVLLVKQSMA